MGWSTGRGDSLMSPLYGRTATFLAGSRRTNLALARTLISSLTKSRVPCAVLDIDALYSSNSDYIFASASEEEARGTNLIVPEPGSVLEAELANLLSSCSAKVLIIDSLNSLYHQLSEGERGSKNSNLAFAVALLSYVARTEKKAVILTMYQRERAARFGQRRPISELSELAVSVSMREETLVLACERGSAWPGKRLSLSIP